MPSKSFHVYEKYIQEYHTAIEGLEKQGFDLKQFKITESETKPKLTSHNVMTGESTYSDDRHVERTFLITKLDALLGYFTLTKG